MLTVTTQDLAAYRRHLIQEEKCPATVAKYTHDVQLLFDWLDTRPLDKSAVLAYKAALIERYAPASVNAALASLNSFFSFLGHPTLRVKSLKLQKRSFLPAERELTKSEYERLLTAARAKSERLCLLLQTICSTGIRVSELRFVTVEALQGGIAAIRCKGKTRQVLLPRALCQVLRAYAKRAGIRTGAIFVSRNGNPLDRSNIWSAMKRLCRAAGVLAAKVFPHNLRHLFARTFYTLRKDIVRLADILGHESINTTRIYTKESGETHRKQLQKLGLLRC